MVWNIVLTHLSLTPNIVSVEDKHKTLYKTDCQTFGGFFMFCLPGTNGLKTMLAMILITNYLDFDVMIIFIRKLFWQW